MQIKIEVTPVLRGVVYEPKIVQVTQPVEDTYGFAEMKVVAFPDLYAGKMVAALDRQHPRDLFDIDGLLQNEGITDELRAAFIIYLISHQRPTHEVLSPNHKDISEEFMRGFVGMTDEPVDLGMLIDAREKLVDCTLGNMPMQHKDFLVLFTQGEPDWKLLGLDGVEHLPAVRWKQINLDKVDAAKRRELIEELCGVLGK